MLRADELSFSHEGQSTRYRFSFEAAPGEVTAISGASGSGKSTLLDLIAGFLRPKTGSLSLDGVDLLPLAPEQRPVSLLLQSDNLFDHLSAAENVELGLPARTDRSTRRRLVEAAMADVGLGDFLDRPASTLSGGQKQRVALARTLLRARPILLLDEPFSALDDETRVTIRALVGRLTAAQNWHTILVSHHADDVEALASRRYGLVDGQLRQV
jgi:thiamine transport system ATP-binding protein